MVRDYRKFTPEEDSFIYENLCGYPRLMSLSAVAEALGRNKGTVQYRMYKLMDEVAEASMEDEGTKLVSTLVLHIPKSAQIEIDADKFDTMSSMFNRKVGEWFADGHLYLAKDGRFGVAYNFGMTREAAEIEFLKVLKRRGLVDVDLEYEGIRNMAVLDTQ